MGTWAYISVKIHAHNVFYKYKYISSTGLTYCVYMRVQGLNKDLEQSRVIKLL